jgi:cytochrome P450
MTTQLIGEQSKTLPYLRELPLLGSLPAYSKDRLGLLLDIARKYPEAGAYHLGPYPMVQFNRPEHAHTILVERAADFYKKGKIIEEVYGPILGDSIFVSDGASHRRQRRLIAPPFRRHHITGYAETITHYSQQIQRQWQNGEVINLDQQMTALAMSIIGKDLYNADVFTETDELGAAMSAVVAHLEHGLTKLFVPPLSWPTPRNLHTRTALRVLHTRLQQMIDERRNTSEQRNDFLSILVRARDDDGYQMDDALLMDECLNLFGAGFETTATAMTWTWYLLCQHPAIYQKVLQEVDTVLRGRLPVYDDLAQLPYCLQVFKEAMRLYPPAWIIVRWALRDVEIDGYPIPKDTIVYISPYTLHRNPAYFLDAEQFNPDRFTPEREKQWPRCAYIPFGAGPRVCLGNHYALMEGHLILATLAQQVTFTLLPGQHVKPDTNRSITLRPSGKVNVLVQQRSCAFTGKVNVLVQRRSCAFK